MTTTIQTVKPQVGDILYSSWGYEQTNIDFYKVVKVSEFSVWIQQVNSKITEVTGWAHENVVPTDSSERQIRNWDNIPDEWGNINAFITKSYPVTRHKIQEPFAHDTGYWVKINSYAHASLWDGKPKGQSHTH